MTLGTLEECGRGYKSITDYKAAPLPYDNDSGFLNDIKDYFGRFETTNSIPAKKSTTSPPTYQSDHGH